MANEWLLEKRVPITFLFTIAMALLAGGMAYQDLKSGIDQNERALQTVNSQLMQLHIDTRPVPAKLARIEALMVGLEKELGHLRNEHDNWENRLNGFPRFNNGSPY